MSIRSVTYQQSVFKRYHSDKHFSEFLPTRWWRKRAGTKLRHCHRMYTLEQFTISEAKIFRYIINTLLLLYPNLATAFGWLSPGMAGISVPRHPFPHPLHQSQPLAYTLIQVALGRVVSASDCGVRGPGFESHRGGLCLSRELLRYAALGKGCTPLLQYLGRLSLGAHVTRKYLYSIVL